MCSVKGVVMVVDLNGKEENLDVVVPVRENLIDSLVGPVADFLSQVRLYSLIMIRCALLLWKISSRISKTLAIVGLVKPVSYIISLG